MECAATGSPSASRRAPRTAALCPFSRYPYSAKQANIIAVARPRRRWPERPSPGGGDADSSTGCRGAGPKEGADADPAARGELDLVHGFALQLADDPGAEDRYRRSAGHFARAGDDGGLARALEGEGNGLEYDPDRHPEARALYTRAAALYRKLGDEEGLFIIAQARNRLKSLRAARKRAESRPPAPWPIYRAEEK